MMDNLPLRQCFAAMCTIGKQETMKISGIHWKHAAAKFFVIAFGVSAASTALTQDDEDAIRTSRMKSNVAIARHDVDAIQSFLDADYVITISTGAIERSRDEHGRSFAAHFKEFPDVVYVRTPSKITVSSAYPLAMERGTWVGTRTTRNGKLESGGEYTAAWRKVDGAWKIYSELFVALYCRGVDC
jgi:ketosteroid isomerase-like protein